MLSIEKRLGKPLSPAVYAFAVKMQQDLDKNGDKGNRWKKLSKYEVTVCLEQELAELLAEITKAGVTNLMPFRARVTSEAAELANFCLFATLLYGKLTQQDLV